jgi:hypothetical protein
MGKDASRRMRPSVLLGLASLMLHGLGNGHAQDVLVNGKELPVKNMVASATDFSCFHSAGNRGSECQALRLVNQFMPPAQYATFLDTWDTSCSPKTIGL